MPPVLRVRRATGFRLFNQPHYATYRTPQPSTARGFATARARKANQLCDVVCGGVWSDSQILESSAVSDMSQSLMMARMVLGSRRACY